MLLQLFIYTLVVGSGYGLIAMSFRLMYSVSPFFNLTLGAVACLAAYMMYWLVIQLGYPTPAAILLSLSAAALFSYALEALVYKPMRSHGSSGMILLVVSLGIYTIFEALIHLKFGPQYQTLRQSVAALPIRVATVELPLVQVLTVIANFAVFFGLNLFLHHTFIGKKIRAVNDSATLSHIIGLRTDRIILIVSVMTGLILGVAGILVGYDTGMEPTMGFNILFKGMIGAIIGGLANLRGAFLGAFFLAFLENLGVWIFASEWRDLVSFVVFIMFLFLSPKGIFQKREKN